jgi:protease IV
LLIYPFRYFWWLISSLLRSFGKPPDYVTILIDADLPALPDPPGPYWQRFVSKPRLSIKELGENFELIARDTRIRGVILHLRPTEMAAATRQDLRELVAKLRKAGKRVVAWAPFYTTGSYYVATACDQILLMPVGEIHALGLAAAGIFLADGLAKVGIKGDFVQISPYKSAADMFTKSKMSPELREQVTWLLESHHEQIVGAIMASRRLDSDGAKALIDGSPYNDDEALEKGVVDKLVPEEDLSAHLGAKIATWDQAKGRLRTPAPTLGLGKYVAVLRIEGLIIDGRSGRPPVKSPIPIPLVGGDRSGDLSVVQVARQIAGDKRAAAAVLYVNSGGGSATASEAMRNALEKINASKPLVVAMGPVAASGGYWVSTPARWIVARPGTITGSIGVLSGKLVTGDLWSKLLFNRELIARGENATLTDTGKPFTDAERAIMKKGIDRIYEEFLKRVGAARKMKPEEVHPMAAGRVWTGKQALDRKLVDELGGLDAAVSKARQLAGLSETAPYREVKAPRRMLAPPADGAAAYVGFVLEGLKLFARSQPLALMDFLPEETL